MAYVFSGTARFRAAAAVLLFCALCFGWGGGSPAQTMLPAAPTTSSTPLLPYLDYLLDETGTMDVEEAAAPDKAGDYRPLTLKDLPRETGVVWLRFTLAPLPEGTRPATLLLDMGESVPGMPMLYEPVSNSLSGALEWREFSPAQRNVLLLPEAGKEPLTCYIRLDGLPGLWFAPMLRTPQDAATNWGSLSRTAAILALGVVMLLCLLRGLSEKGQWRVWTALYVGVALGQGLMGMPASGSGHIGLGESGAVLAPGVALMLLPHVGRHLMRTRERSHALDIQLLLLSLPGAALALLPLVPNFGWLTRYLDLWPLGTLIFVPTALGAWIMGLGGAKRFLLGCLLPPLFVAGGMLGLDSGFAPNLLASAPLWGTALSALIIAATRAPHDTVVAQADATAAKAVRTEADGTITLDQPLDDPNLRLIPPGPPMPPDNPDADASSAHSDPRTAPHAGLPSDLSPSLLPDLLEDALRLPLDRLMREGAALGHCALPPAVRQYAENMLTAARQMADIVSNPTQLNQERPTTEAAAPFNLQHLMREAHDAVAPAAESAGIGLAWYMPPHLGHMYEGEAGALSETLCLLLESAVRATKHGAVHFSVRRVPESTDAGHLLFTVTDTGSGMPPKERSSLALTRAWELAGARKGFLGVECSPHGTTIAFTLHLKDLERDGSEDAPVERGQPLVLVAAESALDRRALARMLDGMPCRNAEARSLSEALQLHKGEVALLLIAQGRLASPAAGDILRQFRELATAAGLPFCKALAVTMDDSQWDRLADAGFTHALLEPVNGEALCQTVREILDAAAATRTADETGQEAVPTEPAGQTGTAPADMAAAVPEAVAPSAVTAGAPAGRPPLPDLFGNEDGHGGSPLKIPDLTALPDLLSFAESLRGPLVGPGEDKKSGKPAGGLFSGLPENKDSLLPDLGLPPADAGLTPVSRLNASRKTAQEQPDIPAGLFVNPYAPDDPVMTAASKTTAVESESNEAPAPASSPEDAAMQAEFSVAAGLEGPVWGEEETADSGTAQETKDAAPEDAASKEDLPVESAAAPAPVEAAEEKADSVTAAENPASGTEEAPAEPAPAAADNATAAVATADAAEEKTTDTMENAPPAEALQTVASAPEADSEAVQPAAESAFAAPELPEEPETATPVEATAPEEVVAETSVPETEPVAAVPSAPEKPVEPEQPRKPAFRPVTFAARPGATIVPIRPKVAAVPEAKPTVTANAGGSYTSPRQNTPGEWVGEPMPIGSPLPPRPQDEEAASLAGNAVQSAPRNAVRRGPRITIRSVPTATARRDTENTEDTAKNAYTSPSLSTPGEWVGEPMPISSKATADRPAPPWRHGPEEALRPMNKAGLGLSLANDPAAARRTVTVSAAPEPEAVETPAATAPAPATPQPREAPAPVSPSAPAATAADTDGSGGLSGSIMDFIAGAEPVKKESPPLAALIVEVSGPAPASVPPAPPPAEAEEPRTVQGRLQMPLPEFRPTVGTNEARTATDSAPPVPPPPAPATPPQPGPDKTILQLVERLDAAMEDAQQAFQSRRGYMVGEAAGRIAAESDAFGFRVLARMARCVERAAKANDMNALKDLLPELAVAVERNRIALTPRK